VYVKEFDRFKFICADCFQFRVHLCKQWNQCCPFYIFAWLSLVSWTTHLDDIKYKIYGNVHVSVTVVPYKGPYRSTFKINTK